MSESGAGKTKVDAKAHEEGKFDDEIAPVLKAGCGLTSAPRRWWEQVGKDRRWVGFEPLRTGPCMWIQGA